MCSVAKVMSSENPRQVKSTIVLPDGKKATGTLTLRPVDADTIVLQGTDRTVDGNPVPDSKEIKLKRVQ